MNTKLKINHVSLFAALLAAGCFSSAAAAFGCQEPLLKVSGDGTVTAGSKEKLIATFNAGERVRVGWQLGPDQHKLSHWAEHIFISVFHGNVYAQLPAIHVQRGRAATKSIELFGDQPDLWYGLIASDGQLAGRYGTGKITAMGVEQVWCAAS